MSIIIRRPISSGLRAGEEKFCVYKNQNKPSPYPWAWAASHRYYTPNTIHTRLTHINQIENWAEIQGIDLYDKVVHGYGLDETELRDLSYHLSLRSSALRSLIYSTRKIYQSIDNIKFTSNTTTNQKLITAEGYLNWLHDYGNRILARRRDYESQKILAERIKYSKINSKTTGRNSLSSKGPYSNLITQLFRPNFKSRINIENSRTEKLANWIFSCDPFSVWPKNKFRALQNHTILLLLAETGIRCGELASLKTRDINTSKRTVRIARRHNDPEDTRGRKPQTKTFDRILRVTDDTFTQLERWLDVRDDIGFKIRAADHPFLFISFCRDHRSYGTMIKPGTIDLALTDACKKIGIEKITAHQLRHWRTRKIAELAKEQGWTHEEWRKTITYVMGWSNISTMPSLYLGSYTDTAAERAMESIWHERDMEACPTD